MNNLKKKKSFNWFPILAWLVFGLLTFGGLTAMILIAVKRVLSGKGLDIYHTKWLVEDTSIGFLIFLVAVVAALIVGGFFRFKVWREIRKLEKKYSESEQ